MKVKKYQAVDMPEALRMIREELGPDAVILSTRQVKPGKGVFGLLGRTVLEVTAAADIEAAPSRPRPKPKPPGSQPPPVAPRPEPRAPVAAQDHGVYLTVQAELESLREELNVLARRPPAVPAARNNELSRLDLRALENKVDRLLEQTARFDAMRLAPGLRKLHSVLASRDVDSTLLARILSYLQEKLDEGRIGEGQEVAAFRELIRRTVRVSGGLLAQGSRPRVAALVGPTGVGKTTTVAKLAARLALQQSRRVALVTVDTFRIAAVEQLKTYAKITGVPLEVAMDAAGLRSAVQQFADRDLVLVDTAGQSPRDEESVRELAALFPKDGSVEVHLVLSVTTRTSDLEKILRRYAPTRPSRLLLTKLDETECHGPLLALPLASRLPVSYLTTGQNVPDDIEEATARGIADYLCRGFEAAS